MPELPEVETVRRGLQPAMQNAMIARVQVNRPNLRWPFPENMASRLNGATVQQLRRRSKYILVDLSTDETLLIHLGMSGRMTISGDQMGQFAHNHPKAEKHDHVVFDMDNGARITFNDPRRFGAMDLRPTGQINSHSLLAKLGPEPLSNAFDETYMIAQLSGRNTPIKSALLDQRIVAGLGNIYVCEVLFRTKISPKRKAGALSHLRAASLVPTIRKVLSDAIEVGGSSLRDFRQTDGELGYFQHSFDVYGREGRPCHTPKCKAKITRITQAGRSSFYCTQCQR
ncbi:bifunctional DNA-formamidopyrimidine glycosylase/DNA-(apurinic or apyrimidinic site) lyase [Pseudopelagicola sp. nBUS_20]|uniref:bifunctional DNA-formamidopyrimidine glycosylase/DNA-(apurinic or apyrimidinic site) lyase n=1 Tax=Pseudopelagicola sp. nBUS_20 TaxID=3395317 RepID=UPI003EBAD78A